MSAEIGNPERITQQRVIDLFTQTLGYRYLGDWSTREGNHCIEEGLLTAFLSKKGYSPAHISAAIHKLRSAATLHGRTLYAANQAVYQLLRYGVSVKVAAGDVTETVQLVDWDWDDSAQKTGKRKKPSLNDFVLTQQILPPVPRPAQQLVYTHETSC